MKYHPVRRVCATLLTLLVWGALVAGAAQAKVPDDPSGFITQPPVVITEQVSWTRYALVAAVACLVGIAATLAVQLLLRRRPRPPLAPA